MINNRERALIEFFGAIDGIYGPNYECKYYPCHFEEQDCSLCFCPFYPCLIYKLGGEITVSTDGKYVWSCKNCWWIHKKENVEDIIGYFSGFSKQMLAEENWYFFNRALQTILFGEEVGENTGKAYNLMPANFYGSDCSEIDNAEFIAVKISNFEIESLRKIKNLDEAEDGDILIPEKTGNFLRGKYKDSFVECMLECY
jgi:hypothetical protein